MMDNLSTAQPLSWQSQKRKISDLIPASYNPRKWPDKEIKDLKASLEKFSLADPIVINANNTVIGGHFRLTLLKEKGIDEVDVRVPDRLLEEAEERELNIRLNRNCGLWDFDALANFDEDLLTDIGFDSKELDKIFQLETQPGEDDVPEVKETDIKLGDIFQLGRHRLMCGDSTQREDVEKLMRGEKSDMLFTSPPYNLGVSARLSGNTYISNRGNIYELYDDNQKESSWLNLMEDFISAWLNHSEYICINIQSLAGNRKLLWQFINLNVDYFCDVAIWNKGFTAPSMAPKVMNSSFEFLFFFSRDNPNRSIRTADFRGTVNNVFDIPPQRKNKFSDIHGATFPVELPTKIIENFTRRGMIIVDCFSGTGSTLIACEKIGRICYGMEISPTYIDVIINRWQRFTNKKAEKI